MDTPKKDVTTPAVSQTNTSSKERQTRPSELLPKYNVSRETPRAPGKPHIYIMYTGGTLGMKKDAITGALVPAPNYLADLMDTFPELQTADMPSYTIVEYDPILDSSDMSQDEWVKIAHDIEQNYYDYDGFVVIMGTDTMAYCASCLSFMFENLGKTVVVTGSQISIAEVINDGRRNLIAAMMFAGCVDIPEVCIFFNNSLFRANRTSKVDTSGLAAFDSPNYPPLATLGTQIIVNNSVIRNHPKGRFKVSSKLNRNIAVLHLVPGFSDEVVANILKPPLQGLVLRSYGAGNAPGRKKEFISLIEEAVARGVLVVVCSQCPKGAVNLNAYATGKSLSSAGAIAATDMTIEAASTKLSVILGTGTTKDEARKNMLSNLRGELTHITSSKDVHSAGFDIAFI